MNGPMTPGERAHQEIRRENDRRIVSRLALLTPQEIAAIIDRHVEEAKAEAVKELVDGLKWAERELRSSTKSGLTTIQSIIAKYETKES